MRVLPFLALFLLPACAEMDFTGFPGAETLGLVAPLPEAEPEQVPDSAQARAAGEPALFLRWQGRRAVAVLTQQNGENRLWQSPGGMVVATDGARVVATAGLREWLAATRMDGPDPLDEPLSLLGREASFRRQVDLMRSDRSPEGMRFGVLLTCRLTGRLEQAPGQPAALVVREQCRGGGQSFTNRFWADPATGGIYRSEQWVGTADPLWLEVVNPPAS